jgi:hypothetical protein
LILSEPKRNAVARFFALSAVLVLQLFPGHFQIAFLTQVSIILMVGWSLFETALRSSRIDKAIMHRGLNHAIRRAFLVLACVAMSFPLSAIQLAPTARLARLASGQRDFNYLSGFAASPLHLVNYVAPGLFHRSPLWRPLVWRPFHTSPEEQLAYVGLVPLFLAIVTCLREFRRDSAVRHLTVLTIATLILSLGPFVPGFRTLIIFPGFSFFRAPARWSAATSLALALLAGKGFDRFRDWPSPARSLVVPAIVSVAWICLTLIVIELALWSGSAGSKPWLVNVFQGILRARPWTGDPDFRSILVHARTPAHDPRLPLALELERGRRFSGQRDHRNFLDQRQEIYVAELAESATVLAGILVVGLVGGFRRVRPIVPTCLILLTFADLVLLGRHRLVDVSPIRPLVQQSPVLARLANLARGTRIVDGFRNLSMIVGLEPISAYRTLDLPALEPLTALARGDLGDGPYRGSVDKAMRATGVGVRVLDPIELVEEHLRPRSGVSAEVIEDPALARWMLGSSWVADHGAWSTRFGIIQPELEPHRVWFVPLTAVDQPAMLGSWNGDTAWILDLFDRALPLQANHSSSNSLKVNVDASGPGWVIVTQLADPQWQAHWVGQDGQKELPAVLERTFGRDRDELGWQRVRVPERGRWTLHLKYDARDVRQGWLISAASWSIWGVMLTAVAIRSRGSKSE